MTAGRCWPLPLASRETELGWHSSSRQVRPLSSASQWDRAGLGQQAGAATLLSFPGGHSWVGTAGGCWPLPLASQGNRGGLGQQVGCWPFSLASQGTQLGWEGRRGAGHSPQLPEEQSWARTAGGVPATLLSFLRNRAGPGQQAGCWPLSSASWGTELGWDSRRGAGHSASLQGHRSSSLPAALCARGYVTGHV